MSEKGTSEGERENWARGARSAQMAAAPPLVAGPLRLRQPMQTAKEGRQKTRFRLQLDKKLPYSRQRHFEDSVGRRTNEDNCKFCKSNNANVCQKSIETTNRPPPTQPEDDQNATERTSRTDCQVRGDEKRCQPNKCEGRKKEKLSYEQERTCQDITSSQIVPTNSSSSSSSYSYCAPLERKGATLTTRTRASSTKSRQFNMQHLVVCATLIVCLVSSQLSLAYQLTNNLIANNSPPKFVQNVSGQPQQHSTSAAASSSSEIVVRVREGPQSIGKLIYTLRAEDPDDDPLTFGVLGSMANELLRIENSAGNQANVYLRKELDRETTESHQVVITLTDGKLGRGNWVSQVAFVVQRVFAIRTNKRQRERDKAKFDGPPN